MKNEIALVPTYWASVSGGKDSLYMLGYILSHPEKYPLNGVVHFELEIDFPFVADVVKEMRSMCAHVGIPFVSIKPRDSWFELYERFGFPTRKARWCNSKYKLDAKRQLTEFLKEQGLACVSYIGYCADEVKRFSKRRGQTEIYPLVDAGITEDKILEWAQGQHCFHGWYITQKRQGCMFCPMAKYSQYAYMLKYYPTKYNQMLEMMRNTENELSERYGKPIAITQSNGKYNAVHLDYVVRFKHLPKLERMERDFYERHKQSAV